MHEIDKTKLADQTKFRLYEIKKIENYFINEISERDSYSKKLNKYVTIFDYIDKILIVLSATSSSVSIISFTSSIGDNDNDNENENDSDNDDEITREEINNNSKKIDETKSFEDQIDIFKKILCLNEYWDMCYYEDNKKTNLGLFKLKLTHTFNDVDDNLFK